MLDYHCYVKLIKHLDLAACSKQPFSLIPRPIYAAACGVLCEAIRRRLNAVHILMFTLKPSIVDELKSLRVNHTQGCQNIWALYMFFHSGIVIPSIVNVSLVRAHDFLYVASN